MGEKGENNAWQHQGSLAGTPRGRKEGWEVDTGSYSSIHPCLMPVSTLQSLCHTLFVHKYILQPPLTRSDTSEK